MAPKRKRSAPSLIEDSSTASSTLPFINGKVKPQRRASERASEAATNPNTNSQVIDGPDASRASPDSIANQIIAPNVDSDSRLSDIPDSEPQKKRGRATAKKKAKNVKRETVDGNVSTKTTSQPQKNEDASTLVDPEAEGEEEADEEEVKEALSRPPPVNSDYLPLPWKGRLGYACLNTYLRNSNPPVFSSRTCRIASILEHRHPLRDPSQPEHPTKNRPDKDKLANVRLGQQWVEQLGLQNARDIIKMVRWNDRYGIKFMRLSSEMFPFASHDGYGYKLEPFAAETLAKAGEVIAELGHRVTTHPGQFTQLGSPRQSVIDASIRDLEYHDEMLSLLKLPPQQDRDAVMILHMGGIFESKPETLDRFRANYARLPQGVKNRLVLENDDVGWSVHDLLPICEELNIPFVLDFHHHNIVFDATQIREGTKDIMGLYPRILATWKRKGTTPKMHYSEQTPPAVTPRQRRKHSPRVMTLPPCPNDMDLMIEAKDKEQAVFELTRTFKLPGYDKFNDVIPFVRPDDNKAALATMVKMKKKSAKKNEMPQLLPEDEVGMGGPEGRVYWPPGMEEWLRPKKREVKKKAPDDATSMGSVKKKGKAAMKQSPKGAIIQLDDAPDKIRESTQDLKHGSAKATANGKRAGIKAAKAPAKGKQKKAGTVITPSTSDENDDEGMDVEVQDEQEPPTKRSGRTMKAPSARKSSRAARVSYAEAANSDVE
ncbi:UV-endonuclease UvdE [Rhizodiscina lignyota]|uniref:UV-endonuclease UvdE n=1 Tax=Rhizodiscina lignyota TaxID=1504668 RepID=A0A9P4M4V2_9PEZI|nr:UV-endonuclease UvdE [Rhizodiscina lignyota]